MEYLVALVFVGATLMVASARLFYSPVSKGYAGDPRVNPKGFGEWGKRFVGFYQKPADPLHFVTALVRTSRLAPDC